MNKPLILLAGLSLGGLATDQAAADECPEQGTALYFGNGINTTAVDADAIARDDLPGLADEAGLSPPIAIGVAYNQTNGIFSDIIQTLEQKAAEDSRFTWFMMNNVVGYLLRGLNVPTGILDGLPGGDEFVATLQELINQGIAASGGETEDYYDQDVADMVSSYSDAIAHGYRVIVVAHSQGNMYAAAARRHLLAGAQYFGVDSVATPAETAPDGYVTSDTDLVIGLLRKLGHTVLPANVHVPLLAGDFLGHGFEDTYINANLPARAPVVRVLADIGARLPYPPVACVPDGAGGAAGEDGGAGAAGADSTGGHAATRLIGGLWGDPHFYTWDGYHYNLQRVGEFVLVQDAERQPLIQARFHPYGASKTVATIAAVAANVDGDSVEVDANGAAGPLTWINGVEGSGALPHGGQLTPSGITWRDGTPLRIVDHGDRLDLEFRPYAGTAFTGLLGDGDGDYANDLTLRDGTALTLPLTAADEDQLVSSWRITQAESLFYYPDGTDTTTYTDLNFPYSRVWASDLPQATYASAHDTCVAAGIPEGALMDACILDVGTTGDPSYATAMSDIPAPAGAPPAIYQFSTNPTSLTVDLVSAAASPISADGRKDGVFDVSVQGPIKAFVVATVNAAGTAAGGSYWENLVGENIPAGVSGLSGASTAWVVGVTLRGDPTFVNNTNGSLPILDDSVHDLTLYVSSDGSIRSGALLRVWAIAPDGSVSPSRVLTY